ncbi:MAG TPA: long-chain fatty acid--CoA ligase [Myxococcales bacterium]|nr:long-chain fatty acid--CoA ligase [Myxococcales bacterium]
MSKHPSLKTLAEQLVARKATPSKVAAHVKTGGAWRDVQWGEVLDRVRALSEGLVDLGIKPGDRVCIHAGTSYEWCLADLALMGAGAISVPIYSSNTPQETAYIINDSEARLVFFDNDKPENGTPGRWARLRSVREQTPTVEHFVSFELHSSPDERLMSLWDLEARGRALLAQRPDALEKRAAEIKPEDVNCILYTSGTAGRPKGVMLTHANWVYEASAVMESGVLDPGERLLLFLPLAHSLARAVEMTWLGQEVTVAFAESIEKLVDNAGEIRPTAMPAVPRVFEKAFNKVVAEGRRGEGLQGTAFGWAMEQFERYAAARTEGRTYRSPQWSIAKRLVFSKVRERLQARFGGQVRAFISGGAPLNPKIAYFFELCGMEVLEGYGLTETCAPTHANLAGRNRIGTVGAPFPRMETKLADDGEVLLRGPNVMKGYYKLPQETAEALTEDGWLRTGDIGKLDPDGYLRITDRKKDLIKTSGGKYIAPAELENALKSESLVSQVSIQGDKRKYVTAVFTINEENASKWAQEKGLPYRNLPELSKAPEVRDQLQQAVNTVNAKMPSYATIKRFAILDHDWSQESGELTPTLKVKRRVVAEKYKSLLDTLYEESNDFGRRA